MLIAVATVLFPALAAADPGPSSVPPAEQHSPHLQDPGDTHSEIAGLEAKIRRQRFRGPVALMIAGGSVFAIGQTIAAASIVSGMTSGAPNETGLIVGGTATAVGALGLAGGIVWASRVQRRRNALQRQIDDFRKKSTSAPSLSGNFVLTPSFSGVQLLAAF